MGIKKPLVILDYVDQLIKNFFYLNSNRKMKILFLFLISICFIAISKGSFAVVAFIEAEMSKPVNISMANSLKKTGDINVKKAKINQVSKEYVPHLQIGGTRSSSSVTSNAAASLFVTVCQEPNRRNKKTSRVRRQR